MVMGKKHRCKYCGKELVKVSVHRINDKITKVCYICPDAEHSGVIYSKLETTGSEERTKEKENTVLNTTTGVN